MAQDNAWWKQGATEIQPTSTEAKPAQTSGDWWKQGATPVTPKRSLMGAIDDTVIEAANAAAGTASAVGNFVRPGNAASGWIDKNIIEAGEAKQSDVVKVEKARYAQEMKDAQGVGDEVGATLGYVARNPILAAAQAAGSFAAPGLAIKGANRLAQAAGLGAKGTTRAGLAAGAALGAAGAGGDAAGTAYELSREGGATDEQATAAARGASVLPAVIGAAGGLVGAERLVAGAKGFGGGLVSRALKTGAVEGAQEAIEEGVTQYEGQRAAVPFNPDLDPAKGVAGAATMGAVLGAATGAGTSVLAGSAQQRVRKPSEDLGLNPDNGPLSKVAAAAVDAAPSAQAQTGIAIDDGLSLAPEQEAQAPKGPSMAERLAVLPAQARAQADQWLREIADERTPEGVKRFRATELQQLLDANPMPQEPSMDIPEEERIAMRPVVRGFDPATGQAPEQPLGLMDPQYQYEGGVNFELQPSPARPSSLIELANWYERRDQGTSDAANPLEQVQQQVRQNTQYTDTAQVQAASQAVEDAWLALNAGESSNPVPPTTGINYEAVPADTTAETDARVRAGRVSSAVRNAFDSGLPNTLSAIQYVNQGLRTIGEQQLTSAEVARIRRLADARTAFEGLNQPAPLPADRPAMPKDPAADNSGMEALIPERTTPTTGQQAQSTQAVPSITGQQLDGEWHAFSPESGTLGVPRAEMPQVFAEHRGALIGYLKGQGVESQAAEVDAASLKPTQAEFSVEKVRKAMDRKGGDRSILVSVDGYVVDGHHQWLAKREAGQPVKVLQLQAPIAQLLPMVSSFPSARTADGAPTDNTQQGQSNGSPTPIDNAPQAATPSAAQDQAPAPALPQQTGVADAIEATQTQQIGAQPQAPSTTATEGGGKAAQAPAAKQSTLSVVEAGSQGIRDLAQSFRERHAESGTDTDRTFAGVLDGFARDVDAGKRTLESVGPALERYQELVNQPLKMEESKQVSAPDAIDFEEVAKAAAPRMAKSFKAKSGDTNSQSVLKGSLARAERQKKEAFDRVKRVRQAVKDGTANRLDLLKAEDAHRALVREVDAIKSSVPQFSRGGNPQTESDAFKRWYGDWQNAGDVPEQLEPHRGRAQSSPDGGGAHVNGLQRSSGLDQVFAGTDRTRWITFSGASGPTGEDGTPVRLYHGTKDDIKAFDLSHPGRKDAGWLGDGIYLSSNAVDAEQYSRAKQGGHGPHVMPLYANVRNPYEASRADKARLKHASKLEIQAFTDDLKSKGHDGVVLWDTGGDMELVAFKPTQVKSATGNNGSFDLANPDIRYSQSTKPATKPAAIQLRRAMVQRTVNALSGAWSQRPSITVVDSMSDSRVPQAVREADQAQRSQGATGEPEGFWYQGQVYLVASALPTSADASRVLYHEVLGHHGLRGHFGEQFDRVLDQVAQLRRKDVEAKAQEYGLDMAKPDHVSYAAEEVLAELAQSRPDLGFVQRAIAAIRNFLRSHLAGFKTLELSDADIVQAYLLPARGWVERGGVASERTGPTRFSFAGERALNADLGSLEAAKRRIGAKEPADRVRKETGWHQGVDGKWRYEISDHEAAFKTSADPYEFNIDGVSEGQVRRLGDVIAHDKLFAAYPSLVNLPVEFVSGKEYRGAYYRQSDRIQIAIGVEPGAMLSTLLHEIQHAIQAREGFSSGGNMNADFVQRIRLAINALPAEAKARVETWVADNQHLIKEANATETIARQALMYESAQRLMSYSNRESPSGVMRLIRSEMEWIYSEHLRDNPDAQQLQRDFYRIPKPSNLHQRNVFLREFAFRGAQLLQSSIPMATLQDFRASPRTTASIVASLGRASTRARQQLAPLQDLKREASNAQDLKDAHDYSGAYDLYTALAGEVEARNTQTRQSMNEEQRKASSPWETADVAKAKTIVVYNGTEFAAPNMEVVQFSRSQPAQAITSSMGQMTPAQERAYRAVAGFDKAPTLKERFDSLKANMGLRLKQALVDQFAPIAQLDQNAYMLARMSKGSDGTLDAALLYGRPFLRDGVPDVDVKEGGFAKVLAGLNGEHDRFLMWVAAQRAEGLKAQGKENLFSDQDITSLKTLNDGQMQGGVSRKQAYAKALMQLNSFNESVLRMAKESGLIDQDAYDLMREQPYVPFYRLMEEEGGLQGPTFSKGLTNQKAWKKLKGGTEQLNADLLQNMLLNWGNLYAASARNRAAVATMDAADKMAIAYKVPSDTKGAAKVMRYGVTEYWMVEDPYLLEAISALNYQASPLMKPLAKAKQWLTVGVTVNPTFKVRNLIRDVVSSMAMADLSYNPAANVAKGWKLTARDSQVYASMLASGGVIKFGTQEQTDRARKQVTKLSGVVLDQNAAQKLWGQVKALYAVYDDLGDRTENINRAALYDRLIAKGHSHAEASFMARDLMDFSMGGNATVVRFLTQSVPFLNARMQGLYKLGRAAKEDPRRFATVAMAVSVASLGLLAAYADDEDWKRREDWDRDSYWWFKIGETAYRIPKPFEVGAIGTLAERTAEAMFDDEMDSKRFMGRISHMVSQTFAFDPVPQAFKPLLDIYANKDSFTGRAIESQADQRLRPEDRFNERTSEVARFLGQMGLPDPGQLVKGEYTGLSPKQIDHLLRGYFSWIATAATTASDAALRHTVLDRGEAPDLRLKDAFLVGNFVESLPTGSSRYVTAMYEQSRAVEQAFASYRDALASGDQEGAAAILESDGGKIRSRASVATATKLLAQLNAQAKRIQADTQLDGSEKRERLTQIEQRRHEIAKRVMGSPAT